MSKTDHTSLPPRFLPSLNRRIRSTQRSATALSDGYDDTVRWPLWKTSLLLISFCGLFWAGVASIVIQAL
ncbi:MAG: hypothetical protein AAGJ29_06655 [Pseudomonadota bacterium]